MNITLSFKDDVVTCNFFRGLRRAYTQSRYRNERELNDKNPSEMRGCNWYHLLEDYGRRYDLKITSVYMDEGKIQVSFHPVRPLQNA